MNKNLTSLVLPHDAYWGIYAPSGMQLWQRLQSIDAASHRAAFEARKADLMPDGQADDGDQPYTVWNGIAIISLVGPMTKAPTSFDEGCSTVDVRRQIRNAVRDDAVSQILLRIDSPGGSVSGTQDLANEVAKAAKSKPVWAYCEDYCCSAAYWVASQAEKVYAGPTAIVGSIGTYMVLQDLSGMAEMMGIKVHVLSTGPQKGAGVPGAEVTDGQLTAFQTTVNDLNVHFLAAVAQGRSIRSVKPGEGVATGDVWVGEQAEAVGLIDGTGSLDDVLQAMVAPKRGRPKNRTQAGYGDNPPAAAAGMEIGEAIAEQFLAFEERVLQGGTYAAGYQYDFASQVEPLAGSTAEQTLQVALAAVGGSLERVRKIKDLRAPQGRTVGKRTLSELRLLHSDMGVLIAECETLPTATEDAPPAEEEAAPEPTSQDHSQAREVLRAALARRAS